MNSNKSLVGEPTTTTTVRAVNKNQTLLEINAAIAATLDWNWSYFLSPSYMKGVFCWRYNSVPLIQRLSVTQYTHMYILVCNAYIWAFFVRKKICVCQKMVIYLGIKTPQSRKERKYSWQKNARISCSRNDCKYTWEKTARISCLETKVNKKNKFGDFGYWPLDRGCPLNTVSA